VKKNHKLGHEVHPVQLQEVGRFENKEKEEEEKKRKRKRKEHGAKRKKKSDGGLRTLN